MAPPKIGSPEYFEQMARSIANKPVVNDSHLPTAEVLRLLSANSVTLVYGNLEVSVETRMVTGAVEQMRRVPQAEFPTVLENIERELAEWAPMINDGSATRPVYDSFVQDLCYREAIRRLAN